MTTMIMTMTDEDQRLSDEGRATRQSPAHPSAQGHSTHSTPPPPAPRPPPETSPPPFKTPSLPPSHPPPRPPPPQPPTVCSLHTCYLFLSCSSTFKYYASHCQACPLPQRIIPSDYSSQSLSHPPITRHGTEMLHNDSKRGLVSRPSSMRLHQQADTRPWHHVIRIQIE